MSLYSDQDAIRGEASLAKQGAVSVRDKDCKEETHSAPKILVSTGVVTRAGLGPDHGMTLERFRALTPRHFFDGAVSDRTPRLLIDRMPGAVDAIVKVAEAACQGRFDLLGYEGLSFGDPVDWRLDPVSGRRSLPSLL